jgi:peptidoglycan biosynthesis protein MviN/MurJ (putative lipid II flippase)
LGALAIAVNLVAAAALMYPMGHAGLACASSIGAYVNLFRLLFIRWQSFVRLEAKEQGTHGVKRYNRHLFINIPKATTRLSKLASLFFTRWHAF